MRGGARPRAPERGAAKTREDSGVKETRMNLCTATGRTRRQRSATDSASRAGRAVAAYRVHVTVPLFLLFFLGFATAPVRAGTTGQLSGQVTDQAGNPVAYAAVALVDRTQGGLTDAEGNYNVINIPPGIYDIRITHTAYKPMLIRGISISVDNTTRLDGRLEETTAAVLEEVVVTAERPVVDIRSTASRVSVTEEQIANLPVQELQDVVDLQAGVVDGHFRGGRIGEVQFQVDGVSVNNPFNNTSSVRVDRSLIREVQVISGVFDAEYGQAMSGVVNAVLKEGTERFEWNAEALGGGFFFPGNDRRLLDEKVQPGSIQNYQVTLSGPVPMPSTLFVLNARRYVFEDYLKGTDRFSPTDTIDFRNDLSLPGAQNEEVALGYTREWSGLVKLTNNSISGTKLSYQALLNGIRGRRAGWAFRYNPEGLSKQRTLSVSHGVDWTQTLNPTTYFTLNLRQNFLDYKDRVYEDAFDPRYDAAGPPDADPGTGFIARGVEFTRYAQKTNAVVVKGAVTSQFRSKHLGKVGGEVQFPRVRFGTTEYLTYAGGSGQVLVRHVNEPPDFPGPVTYTPVIGALFGQDQIEWNDFTVRLGARLEYFDADASVPGDPANPANVIEGAAVVDPEATSRKLVLAPRLAMTYPIGERAGVHFAYGHFYQYPPLGEIFANADYDVLRNLQAGGVSYGVMGNPDIKAEQTVQYEVGYKQILTDELGAELSVFYKDIRDLLGVEFVSTYTGAEYARLANTDFGNVLGVTLSVDQRQIGPLSTSLDYTWQTAQGNSSDPRETATRASAGEDPRPRQIPFNWDQRHTLNLTATLEQPRDWNVSGVLRVSSGQPYTPVLEQAFGFGLEANSGRKPASIVLDLRTEKSVVARRADVRLFGRVFNVFDTRYSNGFVFTTTGSPYYARNPGPGDRIQLANPARFYPPRRIEVGITLASPSDRETNEDESQ